jgi:hypothetical protein
MPIINKNPDRNVIGDLNLLQDKTLICIGEFIKDRLNDYGQEYANGNIVQSLYTYQAFNVPLTSFPVLLVYRTQDIFLPNADRVESFINIDYCLSYPDNEKLAGITNTITKYLHRIVNLMESAINLPVEKNKSRAGGYRIVRGGLSQSVYTVTSYSFSIIEGT